MSSVTPAAVVSSESLLSAIARVLRRNAWVVGLWVVLGLLLLVTKVIQPDYGP
jgi:hypothetical protein